MPVEKIYRAHRFSLSAPPLSTELIHTTLPGSACLTLCNLASLSSSLPHICPVFFQSVNLDPDQHHKHYLWTFDTSNISHSTLGPPNLNLGVESHPLFLQDPKGFPCIKLENAESGKGTAISSPLLLTALQVLDTI